jgi:hypothetical protein
MTSSINKKIQEQIKEKKMLQKAKEQNAEAMLKSIEVMEPEAEVVVEEAPKPKAVKAPTKKKTVAKKTTTVKKTNATKKGKK